MIWHRDPAGWQEGQKLVDTARDAASEGWSVALSNDGTTALIGSFYQGAQVWTSNGSIWTEQGPKLFGNEVTWSGQQGRAAALSADGNTALVGAPHDGQYQTGAAWVWTRKNGIWTGWGSKLVASDLDPSAANHGAAVALSGDGRTALVGGYFNDRLQGGAWLYTAVAPADFDGDGASDRTVFRPSNGVWYSRFAGGSSVATVFGSVSDLVVASDFDGDMKTDIATWSAPGWWRIVPSSQQIVRQVFWGGHGDIPLAGDVDGDRKSDLVAWRAGWWYVKHSTGAVTSTSWGIPGDQPFLADFDGDHRDDFVIYRPNEGVWFVALAAGGTQTFEWGLVGDIPVVGDWDRDGRADRGIFRPSTGEWYISGSAGGTAVVQWGTVGDIPSGLDLDGDGYSDFTLWRPSNGVWYTRLSSGGTATVQWGTDGDVVVGRAPGS
jgi:hypothetical protein